MIHQLFGWFLGSKKGQSMSVMTESAIVAPCVHRGKWGFHPCDFETYRKLRRLNHLAMLHRKAEAAHGRWGRKEPQNRFVRRKVRNEAGQPVGREWVTRDGQRVPIPEPHEPFDPYQRHAKYGYVESDPRNLIETNYRHAKTPAPTPGQVKPLTISAEDIDRLSRTYEDWHRVRFARAGQPIPA